MNGGINVGTGVGGHFDLGDIGRVAMVDAALELAMIGNVLGIGDHAVIEEKRDIMVNGFIYVFHIQKS